MAPAPRKKGTKTPQEAARSAFRDEVRLAAERVFASKGFGATKMADIAAEAGVGVGTLYNYFASKQEIFEAICLAHATKFRAELDAATAGLPPLEEIFGLIRISMQNVEDHGALIEMFFERGGVGEMDIKRLGGGVIDELYQTFLNRLEAAITAAVKAGELRADVPVSSMVAMIAGARNGAIYAWLKGRRRGRIADIAENLLTLFLSGARATS